MATGPLSVEPEGVIRVAFGKLGVRSVKSHGPAQIAGKEPDVGFDTRRHHIIPEMPEALSGTHTVDTAGPRIFCCAEFRALNHSHMYHHAVMHEE